MQRTYQIDNKETSLTITITCNGNKKFRIWAEETGRNNSKYADREILVESTRTIYFSFPVSPRQLTINCINISNPNDTDFKVEFKETPLKKYAIWMDAETSDFVQLAMNFSQRCGFELPPESGRIYQTPDHKFNIKYFPVIKQDGRPISTPARIGHSTGIIETAAIKFVKYTIPMRMCILLHEFSHKYKNQKIGLQISDEVGADINALYIYLGLGFSKIDAICVFANVFLRAQTPQNLQRMRKILDYINRFEKNEFVQTM